MNVTDFCKNYTFTKLDGNEYCFLLSKSFITDIQSCKRILSKHKPSFNVSNSNLHDEHSN